MGAGCAEAFHKMPRFHLIKIESLVVVLQLNQFFGTTIENSTTQP